MCGLAEWDEVFIMLFLLLIMLFLMLLLLLFVVVVMWLIMVNFWELYVARPAALVFLLSWLLLLW